MKYLFVIDMQEDYLGQNRNKKRFPYDVEELILNINKRICEYPAKSVVYITNNFFWEFGKKSKKLVNGLSIVSNNIYTKNKTSAFTIQKLQEFLKKEEVSLIELVGIDGNYCVGISALDGIKKGFPICCNLDCIGVGNLEKFKKLKTKLSEKGIKFI